MGGQPSTGEYLPITGRRRAQTVGFHEFVLRRRFHGRHVVTHTVMNVATLARNGAMRDSRVSITCGTVPAQSPDRPFCAAPWPHLDEIIGFGQHPSVMIDHYHGIAISHQVTHDTEQSVDIRGMRKPNRRLIQHI